MAIKITPIFPTILNAINTTLITLANIAGDIFTDIDNFCNFTAIEIHDFLKDIDIYAQQIYGVVCQLTFDSVRQYALITIDQNHSFIHAGANGGYFVYASPQITINAAEKDVIFFKNEGGEAHVTIYAKIVSTTSGGAFNIYEGATMGAITPVTGFDRNRERNLRHNLQLATRSGSGGTLIFSEIMIGESSTEHAHDKMEFVALPDSWYRVSLSRLSSGESPIGQIVINWYEITN